MIPNSPVPEANLLYHIDLVITILSVVGSLVLCFLCLRVPSPTTLSLKFILAISIADFFYSIANVLSIFETNMTFKLCWTEANIRQVSFILSIFFSACTAIAFYRGSTGTQKIQSQLQFFKKCVTICPLVCLLASVSGPYFFPKHVHIESGPINCSVESVKDASMESRLAVEMLYRGVPIMVGLIVTVIGYLGALKKIRNWQKSSGIERRLINQLDLSSSKLLWDPAASILIFLPSAIDPIVDIFNVERPLWVRALRMAIPHSIGLTNALVYILLRKLYLNPTKPNRASRKQTISEEYSDKSNSSPLSSQSYV